jgi:hypothetical protein
MIAPIYEGVFMMKKFLYVLAVTACLSPFVNCHKGEEDADKALSKAPSIAIAQAKTFEAQVNRAEIIVTAVKNGDTPVKGVLNLSSGNMDLTEGATPAVSLNVDLSTYNSNLIERDDRVRKIFFDVTNTEFKTAMVTIQSLTVQQVNELRSKGKVGPVVVPMELKLHGVTQNLTAHVEVTTTPENRVVVKSVEPVVVSIAQFSLGENLAALIQACGHKSVDDTVKVDFTIEFEPRS